MDGVFAMNRLYPGVGIEIPVPIRKIGRIRNFRAWAYYGANRKFKISELGLIAVPINH